MKKKNQRTAFQFEDGCYLRWGFCGMLIMCAVCIVSTLLMWKCKSGSLFQVSRAIFFLIGYPSKWIFDLLVYFKLINMHDFIALFTTIFVWYIMFGFLGGIFLRFILDLLFKGKIHNIETDKKDVNICRVYLYIFFVMFLLLNVSMGTLILYQKLSFSYVFVKFHQGIYLLRNCIVLFLGALSIGVSMLLLRNRKRMLVLSLCLSVFPVFSCLFSMVPNSSGKMCKAHLHSLWAACLYYTKTHEGNYPKPEIWCDTLRDYVSPEIFLCPSNSAPSGKCNYAMNENIRKGISSGVILFYDSIEGWNLNGGQETLNPSNHKDNGCYVVCIDGYIDFVKVEDLDEIRWK